LHWDVQVFPELNSTQDLCKQIASDGKPEGFVIQALQQMCGLGRLGRTWIMQEGNLALSFILRPKSCHASQIGQISILIGVALAKAIGEKAVLKWPNDILVNNKKCAGVLIDSDLSAEMLNWLVVGIGVNTSQAPPIGSALNVDRDEFCGQMLTQIEALYELWQDEGFGDIRKQWLQRTFPKGSALNVGEFETIDDFGNLIVRDGQNQLKTISAGDVFLKDQNYVAGN